MKATLEYNLPDETKEFEMAVLSKNYYSVIFELQSNFLRQQRKYLDNKLNTSDEEYALLEKITGEIMELLDNYDCIIK
jgi:hypothetical protein